MKILNNGYFKRIEEAQSILKNRMIEQLKVVDEIVNAFKVEISKIDISNILESFREIGDVLKEASDDVVKYKSIIVELGYPPSDETPIPVMRQIVSDYEQHGKTFVLDYIDELMFEVYDEQSISLIQDKWESNHLIGDRIHILRNVIKCHNQMMYHASISTLLPHLEGIVAKTFDHKGRFNGIHMNIYLKHILLQDKSELSFNDAIYKYYIQYLLVHFNHGEDISSNISRNAILHGALTDFGTKSNSLKLILLFDFLVSVLSEVSEETKKSAKEEIENNKKNNHKISVVHIKNGKLHINHKPQKEQYKYVWEEDDQYFVSSDGKSWSNTIKASNIQMD